jgi:DNA-3-methyladenine glycosylase II
MEYVKHLKSDPLLSPLIKHQGTFTLTVRKDLCFYLCNSIMSQQLSTKVADVFQQRFLQLYNGKIPTSKAILDTPFETLRNIGLSNAKANYVHNVARFDIESGMEFKVLNKMENDEIIRYLTQIKGVGKWTVEMLLMFALGREDVFPSDDLGIQQAMKKLYTIKHRDKKLFIKKMNSIAAGWSPYRSYACLHLWHYKDN